MKLRKLIEALKKLQEPSDPEAAHGEADALLLEYIGDDAVSEAYRAIHKWYA